MRSLQVPDLVPSDRTAFRAIFIGESPHRDEVAPEAESERTPFRGRAGDEWWPELAKFLPASKRLAAMKPTPSRACLLDTCDALSVAILNAVQFPIDPKITLHEGEESHPRTRLGFEKGHGVHGYKAVFRASGFDGPVGCAICNLASRLEPFCHSTTALVCLGNDAKWFVKKAMALLDRDRSTWTKEPLTIPHPSSWRRNRAYRQRAVAALEELLSKRSESK